MAETSPAMTIVGNDATPNRGMCAAASQAAIIDRNRMTDLQREANRGQRAKAILEDEIVTEALDAIEAGLRAGWEGSRAEDTADREDAYRMLRAAKAFRERLRKVIDDGAVAQAEIEADERALRRKKGDSE
jgi:signal transduction protein with GAF and PtsI domain